MPKRVHVFLKVITFFVDIVLIYTAFYVAYWIRFAAGVIPVDKGIPSLSVYMPAFGVITFICILVFKFSNLYTLPSKFSLEEFPAILRAVTISAIIVMALTFIYRQFSFSRVVIFLGWLLNLFFISLWRYLFNMLRRRFQHLLQEKKRVLIVGAGKVAKEIAASACQSCGQSYQIVGLINYPKMERKEWNDFKSLKIYERLEDLPKAIGELNCNEVIMTKLPESQGPLLRLITLCEKKDIEFKIIPDMLELVTTRSRIDYVFGLPVLSLKRIQLTGTNFFMKRLVDIFVALSVLTICALPIVAIALAIKIDSLGTVFYRQPRMGYKGKKFVFLKFRSMVQDADDRLKDVIHLNERQGPVFKMKNDPRITRVGKFIRRYSLDELPQFINVLKGDMSIVGPRPQVLWEAAHYDEWAKRRLMVLPGITGLWQVSGRSNLSYEEMIKLDIYYMENWSLWLDIDILLRTIPTVLFARGAY